MQCPECQDSFSSRWFARHVAKCKSNGFSEQQSLEESNRLMEEDNSLDSVNGLEDEVIEEEVIEEVAPTEMEMIL